MACRKSFLNFCYVNNNIVERDVQRSLFILVINKKVKLLDEKVFCWFLSHLVTNWKEGVSGMADDAQWKRL